ncbi:MAG: hypothetical protein RIA69_01155, partial [Cyclobacteriaceae bacterium]
MNHLKRYFLPFSIIAVLACSTPKEKAKTTSAEDNMKSVVSIPEGMVRIPEGNFIMGGKSEQADVDELPRHQV